MVPNFCPACAQNRDRPYETACIELWNQNWTTERIKKKVETFSRKFEINVKIQELENTLWILSDIFS